MLKNEGIHDCGVYRWVLLFWEVGPIFAAPAPALVVQMDDVSKELISTPQASHHVCFCIFTTS
jgi:hypothetical protein